MPIYSCPVWSCLAIFEFNFGGDDLWTFLPFLTSGLLFPVPRKLTACARFGFLEKVAFYVAFMGVALLQ